jgi:hypothetical protein
LLPAALPLRPPVVSFCAVVLSLVPLPAIPPEPQRVLSWLWVLLFGDALLVDEPVPVAPLAVVPV